MAVRTWTLVVLLLVAGAEAASAQDEPYLIAPHQLTVSPAGLATEGLDLPAAVARAADLEGGVTIYLLPGEYRLEGTPYLDPTCGNCEDPEQSIPATLGLRISGNEIVLRAEDPGLVSIHTHAGYGLLFEDCLDCRLEGVTVTDGVRDTSGFATDAALVVRRSTLAIADCRITGNIGDSSVVAGTVVGIMGICGREGAQISVTNCEILRNSWDGIALYRDAHATIRDCLIDGIDRGAEGPACGGRGVAVGITWNARAELTGNLIRRYWKGVGIFVDAEAALHDNVIEEMLTWGIAFWDADRGTPHAIIEDNAVYRTGACGISVTRGRAGGRASSAILRNALVCTGQNPKYDTDDTYCYQRALAVHATQPDITIADNLFFANREPGDAPGGADLDSLAFRREVAPLLRRLSRHARTQSSDFLRDFSDD